MVIPRASPRWGTTWEEIRFCHSPTPPFKKNTSAVTTPILNLPVSFQPKAITAPANPTAVTKLTATIAFTQSTPSLTTPAVIKSTKKG
ncbi:TPA: hypothetical protein DEB02_04740 [Candidatus Beckwithbacteria bacterium]|nr:hypothetical protein [Candidatus Beckwithbacteria bacterium]